MAQLLPNFIDKRALCSRTDWNSEKTVPPQQIKLPERLVLDRPKVAFRPG
jgi:hypothetical protein